MKNKRIVVISSSSSQPRYHRRVQTLLDAGYDITVYTFNRGFYEVNHYPKEARVVSLGKLENGKYFSRVINVLKAASFMRYQERSMLFSCNAVYVFGLDAALISLLTFNNSKLIYEIGDLRNVAQRKFELKNLFAQVEKRVLKRVALLVVTSPGFLSEYYFKLNPSLEKRSIILENKLPRAYFNQQLRSTFYRERIEPGPIKIGFVGLLRYPKTLLPVLEAISKRTDTFELHVYGDGPLKADIERYAQNYSNIFYYGAFKNPGDLSGIYNHLDLSWVVYDNLDINVRLAIPNKLYESLFFGVPIIVAEHTTLARRVEELRAGFIVDSQKANFVDILLDTLGKEQLTELRHHILEIPLTQLWMDDDKLTGRIENLLLHGTT
jgi:succinoglycan biosynthesis protein ExoL